MAIPDARSNASQPTGTRAVVPGASMAELLAARVLSKVAVFDAMTNAQPRPGVLLAQEPGGEVAPRWVVSVGRFRGDHAVPTLDGPASTRMRRRACLPWVAASLSAGGLSESDRGCPTAPGRECRKRASAWS